MILIDASLRPQVPNFAQFVGGQIVRGESLDLSSSPAGLVQASGDEARAAFIPDDDLDLTDARQVGYAWYAALYNLPKFRPAFDNLCVDPVHWADPQALADELEDYGFASGVDHAIEAPDETVFAHSNEIRCDSYRDRRWARRPRS